MTTPMRHALVVFLATMLLGVGGFAIAAYQIWTYPERPDGRVDTQVEIEIPRGVTAKGVSNLLEEAELIRSPLLFRLYTTQRGAAARIRPGQYTFEPGVTPKQLVDTLVKGVADVLVTVTIPEGKTFVEIAEILEDAKVTTKEAFVAQAIDKAFLRSIDVPALSIEGYLFPDTYRLRPGTPADEVALTLVRRHRRVFEELRTENAKSLAKVRSKLDLTDHQIVILASIVEKETAQIDERPTIAQLYLNRLTFPNFQPRILQADPTIIYGCTVAPLATKRISDACAQFKDNNIRTIHLRDVDNEYNTYTNAGMPPGPIGNPGRGSLAAVMDPDGSRYLYFVASGGGRHFFSTNEQDHEAAVVKYQRGGRPMPGSSR